MQKITANRIIALIAVAAAPFSLAAQDSVKPKKAAEKPAAKKEEASAAGKEADKSGAREVTYLDLVHARDKALKLKEDNMRDIQLLNALGAAMPEAVDKGASDQIATEYKEALKLIYRMEYVGAEKTLRTNRENIAAAMGKASEVFRKKTTEMLNQSADRMADLDMQAENTGSAEAIRMAGVVQRNQHRLSVGYQQLTLASTAEKHRRYAEALSHYRLARLHAIYLQIELAKDESEKNSLRAKYRNELDEKRISKEDSAEKEAPPAPEKKAAGK
jgi:hypothetical protein